MILALSGSTRQTSVNKAILDFIASAYPSLTIENYDLTLLPHFNPDLADDSSLPPSARDFITAIQNAAGVIICTPEYVFSLPGIIKNAIEWAVATTVFQDKPTALIVASLSGTKAFESLDLVMTTVGAKMTPPTKLLITGAYSKLNKATGALDEHTVAQLRDLIKNFTNLLF
ncbi:MAG: NAD(P)H-dependent oxidoreductase [Bacteroidetes bacterium]|nr:NAD(P)H-dependent oxidoreductase [Bacteroidota bacterium]